MLPSPDLVSEFLEHLLEVVRLREQLPRQQGRRWRSREELLLAMAGEPVVVERLSGRSRQFTGPLKACYSNAYNAAKGDSTLLYVEGYAQAGMFPVAHAWCVDTVSGEIVDPTWHSLHHDGLHIYLGVQFSTAFMDELVRECGSPCVFDLDWQRRGRSLKVGFVTDSNGVVTGWGEGVDELVAH